LAQRLLENIQNEQEREVIKQLKKDKGATYTSKLETMFQDVDNSKQLFGKYTDMEMSKHLPIEFDAKILTGASWPVKKAESNTYELPKEILTCIDSFYMS
jgi:hypothetical protein